MSDLTNLTISDDMLAAMGFPPTTRLALAPSELTVPFTIPATTLLAEVAAIQMALQGGGYTSANSLPSESFWKLAADVVAQGVYAEAAALNIPSFDWDHNVVPDDNMDPCVEGVIVCSTPGEAFALRMRIG